MKNQECSIDIFVCQFDRGVTEISPNGSVVGGSFRDFEKNEWKIRLCLYLFLFFQAQFLQNPPINEVKDHSSLSSTFVSR